jgi:hypothetical protein
MRRAFQADLSLGDRLLVLATVDGAMVAYGRASRFEPAADAPPNVAPEGYYMGGL